MSDLAEGQVVGDYQIASVAGTGGMGVVYRAKQRALGRIVALKVIREEIARVPEYRERFLREARLAAAVDHPNVVSVYDVGEADDHLYLAMQWVEGQDLASLLRDFGPRSPERAVAIVTQVASALDAVHRTAGLVHRDVKPANILIRDVDGKDHPYLTDFGVARAPQQDSGLTQAGLVVGTTGYMAPEQIMGRDPSARSDLYALGCLFFETITGAPPFRGENEMAVRWAHAQSARPKPSEALPELGTRYDGFIARALAIDPEQRFASGRDFAAALSAAHSQQQTQATAIPQPHTPTVVSPATPLPAQQTPTPTPMYAAYGYATPPPPAAQQSRSGSPFALVLLALIALAGIAAGALAATGVFSHSKANPQTATSRRVASPATVTNTTPSGRPAGAPAPSAPAAGSPAAGSTTSCGGDLSVGPNTSCGFAHNVEQAYLQSSGGDTDVSAFSPATGQNYTMHCTGSVPHQCTGGNNASVFFSSGPSGPSSLPGTPCGGGVNAGANTSCGFAQNVARAYQSSGGGDTDVTASSPATGQVYTMHCTGGSPHTCTGGNNASVYFP